MKCPICKREVDPASPFAPFCSARCRILDLGNWASEKYRIAGAPSAEPEREDEQPDHDSSDSSGRKQ